MSGQAELGHLDIDQVWRDREGCTWRFVKWVGWCWSRDFGSEHVLDEPATPLPCDGPFTLVLPGGNQ